MKQAIIFFMVALLFFIGNIEAACRPSNCLCNGIQGQFCGNEKINKACTNGHVFECQKKTGKACDYGVRTSCKKCNKLKC
ncbi:unnamed protein product [Cunninghamella blakesleeana]